MKESQRLNRSFIIRPAATRAAQLDMASTACACSAFFLSSSVSWRHFINAKFNLYFRARWHIRFAMSLFVLRNTSIPRHSASSIRCRCTSHLHFDNATTHACLENEKHIFFNNRRAALRSFTCTCHWCTLARKAPELIRAKQCSSKQRCFTLARANLFHTANTFCNRSN